MAVHFITVLNGVITGQHCGDINADYFGTPYFGHERVRIPENVNISSFDRIEFYTKKWERKRDMQLIDEGIIPMPDGYVREGEQLRPMTVEERIIAGLDAPPSGQKVEDGKIVPMTLAERLAAGQITQEDYNRHMEAGNTAELQRRLGELQSPEVLAQAEVDDDYAARRKAKLAALLAVKKQEGWPFEVVWPVNGGDDGKA